MTAVNAPLVRSALAELADETYQRRVWTGQSGGREIASFIECVESLFDDSGLGDALERNEETYGSAISDNLESIHALLGRIDGQRSSDEIILDPLMLRVRSLASTILQAMDEGGYEGVPRVPLEG
jgi:hypothetical protein